MSRRLIAMLAGVLFLSPLAAQTPPAGPEGIWEGALNLGALKLRLVFNISKEGDGYKATFDSPDQGVKGLAFTKITFADRKLDLEWKTAATFGGTLSEDGKLLKGDWKQSGQTFPLELKRVEKATEVKRPQTPKPPFPYQSEDVTYPSAAEGVTLAGTLTLPKGEGPFPAVVLISGSGPQDRDETLLEHKPFAVIADHLTRQGIAVLRFDDRGVGKSTGKFADALAADFAQDVRGGVKYLQSRKEIDAKRIGLMGHSEGGLIAPRVAADNREIAFIVLLAAPGVPGHQLVATQTRAIVLASGGKEQEADRVREMNQALIRVAVSNLEGEELSTAMKKALKTFLESLTEEERKGAGEDALKALEARIKPLTSPWMRDFLRFDPRPTLARVRCPVLALTGEKDTQVDAKENLPEIRKALESAGNKAVTVRELPGLNHLFQKAKTGAPSEYATIEETISPEVLEILSTWIKGRR